jgi:chromosome segregation ATPase
MEIVDRLFGVTMEKQGVSKIVTVSLEGAQVH